MSKIKLLWRAYVLPFGLTVLLGSIVIAFVYWYGLVCGNLGWCFEF